VIVPKFSKNTLALLIVAVLVASIFFVYYEVLRPRTSKWEVLVVVDGRQKTFELSGLEALARQVNVTGIGPVKAVSLLELLQLSGYAGNATLVRSLKATGADGYTVQLDYAFVHLAKVYIVLGEEREAEWGAARLVLEGLSRKLWVKHLVRVEAETGPWALAVMVDNETRVVMSLDELKELAVQVEGLGESVALGKLLQLVGVSAESVELVEFVGADGYRSAWSGSRLPDAYVVLVTEPDVNRYGPLRGGVLGLPKSAWVYHLVAVNVLVRS
jgi:hypothetical protein